MTRKTEHKNAEGWSSGKCLGTEGAGASRCPWPGGSIIDKLGEGGMVSSAKTQVEPGTATI